MIKWFLKSKVANDLRIEGDNVVVTLRSDVAYHMWGSAAVATE